MMGWAQIHISHMPMFHTVLCNLQLDRAAQITNQSYNSRWFDVAGLSNKTILFEETPPKKRKSTTADPENITFCRLTAWLWSPWIFFYGSIRCSTLQCFRGGITYGCQMTLLFEGFQIPTNRNHMAHKRLHHFTRSR